MEPNYEDTSEIAYEEMKRILDEQSRAASEMGDRSFQMIKINFILLGVIVAGLQYSNDPSISTYTITLGMGPLVLSVIICWYLFTKINPVLGINDEGIPILMEEENRQEAQSNLAVAYGSWARLNYNRLTHYRRILSVSFGVTLAGVAYIGLGLLGITP